MALIEKMNYNAHSAWDGCVKKYTQYSVNINGKTSYFHRIDNEAKNYESLSRHEMAVRLAYFRKTGYKYVDSNIPSHSQPGCTIDERFDFIRKNGYTPCREGFCELYWSEELNAWAFHGNLEEYSYAWNFYIYDRSVVDYILEQLKTLPEEWQKIKISL